MSNLWEAHSKGRHDSPGFEICVIRKSYKHGHSSFGWFDRDKLLISSNSHWALNKTTWDKLIKVAQELAQELNEAEKSEKGT